MYANACSAVGSSLLVAPVETGRSALIGCIRVCFFNRVCVNGSVPIKWGFSVNKQWILEAAGDRGEVRFVGSLF